MPSRGPRNYAPRDSLCGAHATTRRLVDVFMQRHGGTGVPPVAHAQAARASKN